MIRDLLWTLRWLRKNPLFTTAVTAILALGIGANTAVFSIVDAVLLRPLPYRSPERLVQIEETRAQHPTSGIPVGDYLIWGKRGDVFESTVPYQRDVVTLTGGAEPDQVNALRTSTSLFSVLGVRARLGRTLIESDDSEGANAAVLSDRIWRRLFHADPSAIGRPITVSGQLFTIVGVMPPEFEFPFAGVEMWLPLRVTPAMIFHVQVIARVKDNIPLARVQAAMEIAARQLEQREPKKNAGLKITVTPWQQSPERQHELTLVLVFVAVGLVLLIACANVGSLLLSRAVQRQNEIAIRASLGAGLRRILQQLAIESLVLAAAGSAAGLLAAHYALHYLREQLAALPIVLPHLQSIALNGRALVFSTVLCLLLAGVCSAAPVLFAARTDLQSVLRGGHSAGRRGSTRLFSLLIASQAAFAVLLLAGSGLMIRSLIRLQQIDPGFRPDHVLTMRAPIGTRTSPLPGSKYDTKPRQMAYYEEVLERLQRVPGVTAAALVNNLPLSGFSTTTVHEQPDGTTIGFATRTVSARYFTAMGIPLLAGRVFSEADRAGAPEVAIINEYLAREMFPNVNPIGRTIPGRPITVVGVVKDSAQVRYDQPAKAEVYRPYLQYIFGTFLSTIVVRTSGDPLELADTLRKEIWAVDPDQPVLKVETMDGVIANSIWRPRVSAWLFSVLGGLALFLTAAGVYGVVAYTTALRMREVGIRVALGATPARIMRNILRGVMTPLTIGVVLGLGSALLLSHLLSAVLYGIRGSDPVAYAGAGTVLLAIGAIASARPAWRAAVSSPLLAIRNEL